MTTLSLGLTSIRATSMLKAARMPIPREGSLFYRKTKSWMRLGLSTIWLRGWSRKFFGLIYQI
jgi:hypothetical protein